MHPVIPHGLVKRGLLVWPAILLVIFSISFITTQPVRATTFEVNSPDDMDDTVCDSSHCSLREAINAANAASGADTITFEIGSGGLQTITPTSPLPDITDTMAIDGTTQPGFTNAPLIEVNGTSALGGDGFTFRPGSDNSSLHGLVINHFGSSDIVIAATGGISITGNYIGTDPTGTIAAGDNTNIGIYIWGVGSDNITIGGTNASDRNLISGGNNGGVVILNGDGIVIQGNYIGTDVTGTVALGNDAGIVIIDSSSSTIGGTAPGAGNIIRYNDHEGISLDRGSYQIRGNQISNNGGLGIDLGSVGVNANDAGDADSGGNGLQNFPIITSAVNASGTLTVNGTLNSTADATFTLDFYSQAACDSPGGYGEGETYLGSAPVNTDGFGDGLFTFTAPSPDNGAVITATATNSANETSEFSACANVAGPITYVVNTTTDTNDGLCNTTHCSLREAITAANAHTGADEIHFAIGSGLATITPTSALPTITGTVTIDGTTQPGFTTTPLIELNGTSAGALTSGLYFDGDADGSTVRGLVINRFVRSGILVEGTDDLTITGNYIGTTADGTAVAGNGSVGLHITFTTNSIIGGITAADRNIISGNVGIGLLLNVTTDSVVMGNYIGTDVTGTVDLGNVGNGIYVYFASTAIIGGTGGGEGNLISGNSGDAIISDTSTNTLVEGNIIRGNDGVGVAIIDAASSGNQIRANEISDNLGLGIDLNYDGVTANDPLDADTGPNSLQNFPVITSASYLDAFGDATINGMLNSTANTLFELHLYSQLGTSCDPSGYGEGHAYLGSTAVGTNGSGIGYFSFSTGNAPDGQIITLTATNPANETSEFSPCFTVVNPTIIVNPTSGLGTTEAGATTQFTMVLNSQPTRDVTIGLSNDDTTEGTVFPSSVTFTSANWFTAQTVTVTGVDDSIDDGNVVYNIVTAPATSDDLGYGDLNPSDVSVTNTDDADTSGISIDPTSGLTTTEAGGTATFTVVLNSQPAFDVSIDLSSSNAFEGTVSPTTVTFTPANWATAQTVTITGAGDLVIDGNVAYQIITAAAISTDTNYSGLDAADVSVTNEGNDAAGIIINPTSGLTTTEAGGTATFTVVLNRPPANEDVSLNLSSSDTTEGTVLPISLTFTYSNWYQEQTVTITGVDDGIDDGNVSYNIITEAATSVDSDYNGLNAADVSVTNTDDDTQTATVQFSSSASSSPDETGTTYDIDVAVTTSDGQNLIEPITVDVSDLAGGDATAGSDYNFSKTTLTFAVGAADGSLQSATVAVVTDPIDEQNETVVFGLDNVTGANASLGSQTDHTLTIIDDDVQSATVAFSSSGFTTTDESGTSYSIDVVLTTSDGQPLINQVVVDVTNPNTGTATLGTDYNFSAATLFFDMGDASGTARTPNFAVTSDNLDEADETADFGLVNLIGTNASLGAQTTHTLTITDDDGVGVTVTPHRLRVRIGQTRTYTVVLNTEPTADVTIRLNDPQHCLIRPRTLTFTAANWNTPQTVRVRTRNHPDTRCVIRHTATGGGYDGVAIANVVVKIP